VQVGELAGVRVEAGPVAGRVAGAAVDDEVLRAFGHLGVEVVVQHAQRRFGRPAAGGEGGAASCADDRATHFVASRTASTAALSAPERTSCPAAAISGARCRSGPGPCTVSRSAATAAAVAG